MSEVKKCIRSLAVCYMLLAVTIFPETGMIPKQFPTYRFFTTPCLWPVVFLCSDHLFLILLFAVKSRFKALYMW